VPRQNITSAMHARSGSPPLPMINHLTRLWKSLNVVL